MGSVVGAEGSVGGANPAGGVGNTSDPNKPLSFVGGRVGVGCCTFPCGRAFSGAVGLGVAVGGAIPNGSGYLGPQLLGGYVALHVVHHSIPSMNAQHSIRSPSGG